MSKKLDLSSIRLDDSGRVELNNIKLSKIEVSAKAGGDLWQDFQDWWDRNSGNCRNAIGCDEENNTASCSNVSECANGSNAATFTNNEDCSYSSNFSQCRNTTGC